MNRRLKHRIAPAVWANAKRLPKLILVVSAAITITPEAMARVMADEASPIFTKVYSKDELKQKVPENPVSTLDDRLKAEVTAMFEAIAVQQSAGWNQGQVAAIKTQAPDRRTWLVQQGAFKAAPKDTTDVNAVRMYFAGESQRAASEKAKKEFSFLKKMTSGFDTKLDLGSSLAKKTDTPTTSGNVRYALVLKDIVPARAAVDRAAIHEADANEMQFAGHADVHWTIGPVDEEQGRKLFQIEAPEGGGEPVEVESQGLFSRIWNRFKAPKTGVNTRIRPDSIENLASIKKETLPTWQVEAAQEEDLLALSYQMKTSGEKLSQAQEIRLPVGAAKIGRRFGDHWQMVQTSAYNILFDKRMPLVSVHYMHVEERYKGDVTFPIDSSTKFTVTAQGKAHGPLAPRSTAEESYTLDLSTTF